MKEATGAPALLITVQYLAEILPIARLAGVISELPTSKRNDSRYLNTVTCD